MDIDISVLRLMEREKDIPFDVLVNAIEEALLTAYEKTDGAVHGARVDAEPQDRPRDRAGARSGTRTATVVGEYDDTPEGFGRVAATTAKQVILQRLRDAEDEQKYGEFSGVRGRHRLRRRPAGPATPRTVLVDLGKIEAICRRPSRCRASGTSTAPGSGVRRGGPPRAPRPAGHVSPHPSQTWCEKLFALEVPEIADGTVEIKAVAREAGHRTQDRGASARTRT